MKVNYETVWSFDKQYEILLRETVFTGKMASIDFKTLVWKSCIKYRLEWAKKVFKNMKIFIQFNFSQINFGLRFSPTVLFFLLLLKSVLEVSVFY